MAALTCAGMLAVLGQPATVRADGILDGVHARQEVVWSLFTTKTTDASGATTTIDATNAVTRSNYRINHNLFPNLNINAGGTTERSLSHIGGDVEESDTANSKFRPYVWLTLRDPVFTTAVGYDLSEDHSKRSHQPGLTLTRATYNGSFTWKPVDLPVSQIRYTRTSTTDNARHTLDTDEEQYAWKTEYTWRGLSTYYAGSRIDTNDRIRELASTQTSHDGKLLYTTTLFDGRVSLTTDNRLRYTELTTQGGLGVTGLDNVGLIGLIPVAGLSAIDDTPQTDPLAANAALIDGDVGTGAGVDIGSSASGGLRRNLGLDFGTAVTVTTLRVWVDRALTPDVSASFTWDVYSSTNGTDWALHATVAPATFGPFDQRFELTFPAVTTRFIKAVTRPLFIGVPGAVLLPNISITEVQAFVNRAATAGAARKPITQTVRTHNLDVRVVLFRTPSLYYRFNADYQEFDPEAPTRYNVSNGLYFTHRLHPMLSTSLNGAFELGSEQNRTRTAMTYSAALNATPLPTLTDSLVWSGSTQRLGSASTTTNSLVFYNTAQLYQGVDVTLNLGGVMSSEDEGSGPPAKRRELYVNLGANVSPHPALTLSAYYLGKQTTSEGGVTTATGERTENRLDLGFSFTPFRTLSLTASANIGSGTGEENRVSQNYGINWSPFPDGNLQIAIFYGESELSNESSSRIIQPSVRWYLTTRRRSYVEATWQRNTSEAGGLTAESQLFSMGLTVPF